jgi:hydrogenase nickel incorporation protein HypB
MPFSDFDIGAMKERVKKLNPKIEIVEVSCRTGEGVAKWADWLRSQVREI